jgi:glycerophosphoryl diester phosphodiesterase
MTSWAFLDHAGPLAIAHRGGALDAPENSLEAFAAAAAMGYRYVETDVHCTVDGHVVAFHDDRLDRVTDRTGRLDRLRLSEVRRARIGGSARIPLLEELLEELPEVRFTIDPKHNAVVEPLAQLIARMGAIDRVCVGSFSSRRIERAVSLLGPRLCTGMGPRSVARLWSGVGLRSTQSVAGVCAQVPTRRAGMEIVTERFVQRAHALGKVVHVWVVDDAVETERLLDLGVDGVMTDRPGMLRDVMVARGHWAA